MNLLAATDTLNIPATYAIPMIVALTTGGASLMAYIVRGLAGVTTQVKEMHAMAQTDRERLARVERFVDATTFPKGHS